MKEILLTTLCAIICGGEGWHDIACFGKAKLDFLRNYLDYSNGIPTDDTFRRFYRAIDSKVFRTCFTNWIRDIFPDINVGVIAIDGKCARRSHDGAQKALHMVHAFASEAGLVLGQQSCVEKSNEITAIPELLSTLDIKNHTISIDAMGCQKKIACQIHEQGGDYVLSLKGNQKHLYNDVEVCFEDKTFLEKATTSCEKERGHGREEVRKCTVIDIAHMVPWMNKRYESWKGFSSIIQIESERTIKGKTSYEKRYYISSMMADPDKALYAVRSHWSVENSLHWVLDMSFNEDQSRIRKQNAPENIAIIKHFALNMGFVA